MATFGQARVSWTWANPGKSRPALPRLYDTGNPGYLSLVSPLPRFLLTLLASAATAWAAPHPPSGQLLREPGAIYLEDFVTRAIRVGVLADAPIYFQPDKSRSLGILRAGQTVEIQAIGDGLYRVRGQAQQGQVAGWVEPKFLGALKPEFLDGLRQNAVRRGEIQALTSRNEVAINMTPDEVRTSLGRPSKKTSRIDAGGRSEVWEYVRYKSVPQQGFSRDLTGQLVSTVYYIKVPNGKLSVVFDNNLVSSLEQTEGSLAQDARAKIIAPPLNFAF